MIVININGTSANTCKCGSWLDHYKAYNAAKNPAFICAEATCLSPATVGAHVQIKGSRDMNWYIVPFCAKHNAMGGELQLSSTLSMDHLASANVANTCGSPALGLLSRAIFEASRR